VVEIQPRCASWESVSSLAAEVQISHINIYKYITILAFRVWESEIYFSLTFSLYWRATTARQPLSHPLSLLISLDLSQSRSLLSSQPSPSLLLPRVLPSDESNQAPPSISSLLPLINPSLNLNHQISDLSGLQSRSLHTSSPLWRLQWVWWKSRF